MGTVSLVKLLEHRGKIGKPAMWIVDPAVRVQVNVLDATSAFGHIRFLIAPTTGSGEKWVDMKYLEFSA